jgi:hypothetical protein
MPVINEPEVAVAAGLCVTARALDPRGVTTPHPRRCTWCDYDRGELARMVQGYNAWAGYSERSGTYERHEARVFAELPRDEQLRRIVEAQGLEPEQGVGGSDPSASGGQKDRPASHISWRTGSTTSEAAALPGAPVDDALDVEAWLS